MNQDNNRSCNYELLPLAVIEAAHAGDPSAMDRVLRHYDRYIKKLCTRKLYDDCGQEHYCVDEYMNRRLIADAASDPDPWLCRGQSRYHISGLFS